MIHFLGSDVHRVGTIYPQIPKVLKEVRKIVGEEKVEELTNTNPRLVLENKEVEIDDPVEIKLSFTEKLKMNKKSR